MNPREKVLLGLVGAALLLFMGKAVRDGYLGKLKRLDNQIKSSKKDLSAIEREKEEVKVGLSIWGEAGRQTLSMDLKEARTLLRNELYQLTDRVGMPKADVRLQEPRFFGKKNGLRVLPCSVQGEAELETIIRFLFELSRQPYLVRCKRLKLERPRPKQRSQQSKKEDRIVVEVDTRLLMKAELDTLILPKARLWGQPIPLNTADLESEEREPTAQAQLAKLDDYASILAKKLFQPYVPPAPAKVSALTPGNGVKDLSHQGLILEWKAADRARKYKIFFGDRSPGQPQPNEQANTRFRPTKLVAGKKYYWRIDSIGEGGITAGDVWSFTTKAPPPPPPAPKRVSKPKPKRPPPPPKPAGPPPCKPTDGYWVIGRVLSSPRVTQIVLENPRNANAPDERKELGDDLYCGTLILIHPKGAVSDQDGERRFHPIGAALKDCQPLTEEEFPLVFHELAKLEEMAAGISKRPG